MLVARPKDLVAALVLLGLSVVPLVTGLPNEVLGAIQANPTLVRGVWVAALLYLLYAKYYLTATVLAAVALLVRFELYSSYVYSQEGILAAYAAAQKRDPRFDTATNLDLQIGEGTLARDPARWLDRGQPPKTLLLYPPSPEQLALIGNNGKMA